MNTKMKSESSISSNDDEKKDPDDGEIAKSGTNPEDQEKLNKNTDSTKSESLREEKSAESESKTEITTESESSRETESSSGTESESDIVKDDSEENSKNSEEAVKKDDEENAEEEENILSVSKLEAEALSASLSSSRCLLKRNRGDMDTDSDSDDKHEEPDSKKSHTAQRKEEDEEEEDGEDPKERSESTPAPVVVSESKLSSSELLASMSSSKSVLKRGIEQVEDTSSRDNEEAPEPEVKVKKSLTRDTQPIPLESSISKNLVEEGKEKTNSNEVNKATDRLIYNVKSSVISPLKSECPLMESTRLTSPESGNLKSISEGSPLRATPTKSIQSPKEPVRMIAAKDLEEDRKLERKRLNKMLLIFPDQKPV